MKKLSLLLPFILALGMVLSCVNLSPSATLGQDISLQVARSARIDSEDLALTFVSVTGDSRCPNGVVCIWAGQAVSVIKIMYSQTVYMVTLTQMGGGQPATQDFFDYRITSDLRPYPVAGKTPNPADYRLILNISKN